MLLDMLFFIFDNVGLLLIAIPILIILYSWISMVINKDYKFIVDYSKKYKNRVLTLDELDSIRHEIQNMEGIEFEKFCNWLFKKMGKYKSVTLTPPSNDGGRDLIVVDEKNITSYVECKRYTDKATVTEKYMIGREICQKLIGAMVVDNIEKGIIVTTGNIHENAWDYINKLEKKTDLRIEVMNLNDIMSEIQAINSSEVLNIIGLNY